MLLLITSVLIGILSFSCGQPNLDVTSLTINVVKGKTAVLPCTVNNLGLLTLIWFSPEGDAIATDTQNYKGERHNVTKTHGTDYNLVIKNVTESDAGVYVCMITIKKEEKRVTLKISSPPTIDLRRSSYVLQEVNEGDNLNLKCIATGKPEPTIRWYRTVDIDSPERTKEDLGTTTGQVLVVNKITREAAGTYECVASNNLPPDVSREFDVTVNFPPFMYKQTDRITTVNGKKAVFECVAEGFPLPSAEWLKDGTILSSDSSKYSTDLYEEKDTLIYSLGINDINDGDYGVYTCEATNRNGHASHEYLLEKKGAPKITVESPFIRRLKSENAELVCRVTAFPTDVSWFKNGEPVILNKRFAIEKYIEDDVTVSSLTILTLESSDFDTYICQARNKYGSDEVEINLQLNVMDISGPSEVKVGGDITIVCNATTNSIGTDEISWLKNGKPLRTSSRITTSRDIDREDKRIFSKLIIKNMKIGDKGTYTCRTKTFLFESHIISTIQVPDDFIMIDRKASSPTNLVFNENSGPVHLKCLVEGFPRVLISWYRYDGEKSDIKQYTDMQHYDEVLTLESNRSVTGTYRCKAFNGKKEEETLDIKVDIHFTTTTSTTRPTTTTVTQPTTTTTESQITTSTFRTNLMPVSTVVIPYSEPTSQVPSTTLVETTTMPIKKHRKTTTMITTMKPKQLPEKESKDQPTKTDKELVKQGQGSGDNMGSVSGLSYTLLTLTVLLTFRITL